MAPIMKATYRMAHKMIMVFISGPMATVMKGFGNMEGLMEEASSHIMMVMFCKEYSKITST